MMFVWFVVSLCMTLWQLVCLFVVLRTIVAVNSCKHLSTFYLFYRHGWTTHANCKTWLGRAHLEDLGSAHSSSTWGYLIVCLFWGIAQIALCCMGRGHSKFCIGVTFHFHSNSVPVLGFEPSTSELQVYCQLARTAMWGKCFLFGSTGKFSLAFRMDLNVAGWFGDSIYISRENKIKTNKWTETFGSKAW